MLTLKNFEDQIGSVILQKGKHYYSNGNVVSIEETGNGLWSAEVVGSNTYQVEVALEKNNVIVNYFCDCPYDGGICKHVAAIFFSLQVEIKKVRKNKKNDIFETLVQSVTHTDYQNFIRLYAAKNKTIKLEFELFFADKDSRIDVGKKYSDLVQKLIRKYSNGGYVEYSNSYGLSREIDKLLETGLGHVAKSNFKDSFALVKAVLKPMMSTMEYCDDSNGDLGGSIESTIYLLEKIITAERVAVALKEDVFKFLETELSNKIYFDYGDFGYHLFPLFQNLAVQLNKDTSFLAFIDTQILTLTGEYDNYRREYFKMCSISFFQQTGKAEEAEKLVQQNLDIVEVRMNVLNKAIEKSDFETAKKLIRDGIKIADAKSNSGTVSQWQKELLRIAILEKDVTTIRHHTKHFAFDRGFSIDYYCQWKNTFPSQEWESTIEDHIEKVIAKVTKEWNKNKMWHPDHPPLLQSLAPIYIQEKYWDRLLALVQQANNLNITLEYHPFLVKKYSSELLALYLPALEEYGARASNRNEYADLVQNMKKIIKDIPNGKEGVLLVAKKLKERFSVKPRRAAMIDELSKII